MLFSHWVCIIYSRERLLKTEGERGFWIFAKKVKGSNYSFFKLTGITGYVSVMTREFLTPRKTKMSEELLKSMIQTKSYSVSRVNIIWRKGRAKAVCWSWELTETIPCWVTTGAEQGLHMYLLLPLAPSSLSSVAGLAGPPHSPPAVWLLLDNSLYWMETAREDKHQGAGLADQSQPCVNHWQ